MAEEGSQQDENESNRQIVEEFCKPFVLNEETCQQINDLFLAELQKGLCKYTQSKADVKCYPTYVERLPTRCERGKFLALDVGGSNFRILLLIIQDVDDIKVESQNFQLPPKVLTGPGEHLFEFFAECMSNFIQAHELQSEEFNLGFTFSFPLMKNSLNEGILISWSKDFECQDVVGHDVVAMLEAALSRRDNIHIKNIFVLNGTTATLISCAWKHKETKIGVTIDQDTNAAYEEKMKHIQLFNEDRLNSTMLINTQWSSFGDHGALNFMRSPIDFALDASSTNPNEAIFDKMVAGMYMGEIVRLTMIECINAGAMLKGNLSEQIDKQMVFNTKHMSQIENEKEGAYQSTRQILETMGYKEATNEDCDNLRYICNTVSTRSAELIAICLACLVDRIGDPYIVIGIDGEVYNSYPNYHERLRKKTKQLVRPEHKFSLQPTENGSAHGAALLAATEGVERRHTRQTI
uniref:Phosphotransferase n=1 Tax=Glossina palpalis gambiensis TaxID=67801 RepID=A0A240SXF9_9MUSC